MKVGILTYHRAINYGAVLQAFALKRKVEALGEDADIIDYRNEKIEALYAYPVFREQAGIKNKLKYLFCGKQEKLLRAEFEAYRQKYLQCTGNSVYKKDTLCQAAERYDRILVGSDQVWNPNGTDGDLAFLLDFAKPEQKCSYAASFGGQDLEKSYQKIYRKYLESFRKISVREPQGQRIVQKLGLSASVQIDPVFLLPKQQWEKEFSLRRNTAEHYVLIYTFRVTEPQIRMAKACAAQGMKIKCLGNPLRNTIGLPCEYIRAASPETFLQLIYNADFVITNSFHGSAFSLLFHRPMAMEYNNNGVNSRLENLCALFGIENRMLWDATQCEKLLQVSLNWESVDACIAQQQEAATEYLMECFR